MKIRTLVVGGTGPTGVHIVNFLIQAGHEVSIFNSGKHDSGVKFAGQVERIYGNPRDEDSVHQSIATREWDVAICTYGKLTMLASQLAGKTKRLVGITGQPVYKGAARRTPPPPGERRRRREGQGLRGTAGETEGADAARSRRGGR